MRMQMTPKNLESFIFCRAPVISEPKSKNACGILEYSSQRADRYSGARLEKGFGQVRFLLRGKSLTQGAQGGTQGKPGGRLILFRRMSRRGKFITFEGLDGTGKSTQMRKLGTKLRTLGYTVVRDARAGRNGDGGKNSASVCLDSATERLSPMMAEMALMFASRAQHIAEVIRPSIERGHIVLCDRFTDSTEAYQGSGRKLGSEAVLKLHRVLCGDLQPDLTILLESDLGRSLGRARRRNRLSADKATRNASKHVDENRFEQQNRSFFSRVKDGYAAIARREPQRVIGVDASGTPGETHRKIMEVVGKKLKLGPAWRE